MFDLTSRQAKDLKMIPTLLCVGHSGAQRVDLTSVHTPNVDQILFKGKRNTQTHRHMQNVTLKSRD